MTEIQELEPTNTTEINGVTVTAMLVMHACGSPPLALRLECDNKVIAYTGDTAWTDTVVDVAHGADLLIAEALTFERLIQHHLDYASLRKNRDRIRKARDIRIEHVTIRCGGLLPSFASAAGSGPGMSPKLWKRDGLATRAPCTADSAALRCVQLGAACAAGG